MRKTLIFAIIITMLLLLAACGSQMKAKPANRQTAPKSPTGAATTEPAPEPEQPRTTAAEAIKDLRNQMQQTTTMTTTKQGSTGMPPAPEGLTGKEALKARTKALFSKGTTAGNVEADREFGPRQNS